VVLAEVQLHNGCGSDSSPYEFEEGAEFTDTMWSMIEESRYCLLGRIQLNLWHYQSSGVLQKFAGLFRVVHLSG
jgi:hypothetical protein